MDNIKTTTGEMCIRDRYTAVPDVTPDQGIFDEAGFNEYGVSISATVSASANDKIQKVDPYVKDGLAESGLTSIVLPSVKTAREGVELIAKIVEEKGAAEGNIWLLYTSSEIGLLSRSYPYLQNQ